MHADAFIYLNKLRSIAFALSGVTEATAYGTPGFYTGKKLFARLREEGDIMVVYTEEREKWMEKDPDVFYITDHYINSNYMLVAMPLVTKKDLEKVLLEAWQKRSTQKTLAQYKPYN